MAPYTLPAVPFVDTALGIRVVYPPTDAEINARDSTFIFGSVGSGRATLSINGVAVPVYPNGAFLAFLPVPPRTAPSYSIVAVRDADTARAVRAVRILAARPVLSLTGPLVVDSASVTPSGSLMMRPDEPVRVALRAPPNASVALRENGTIVSLQNAATPPAVSLDGARLSDSSDVARFLGDPARWATDVPARLLRDGGTIIVSRDADTVRLPLPKITLADAESPLLGLLGGGPATPSDTDRTVIARPTPLGTYKWLLLPGVVTEVTGRQGDFVRVRLDAELDAWVLAADVRPLPHGSARPVRVATNARLVPAAEWVDLVIPVSERPAHLVEESGDHLALTLYDTHSNIDIVTFIANDSLVRGVQAIPETRDRVRVEIALSSPVFGYLAFWDRGNFVLRLRRPPRIDPRAPLRGLRIAVDPGHPPIGATGPTGLYEGDAVLEIGERVKALLEARGATVIMTRTTRDPVALNDRPVMGRQADAHAFVSIHLNALPDGINPFISHGTGTYYFVAHSEPLAREIQRGLVRWMGLRDIGIHYNTFAVTRATWYPSILAEGAFIMMPDQEAALRTPEFQSRYAEGLVEGLEAYFRSLPGAK
jgi:N-acetylmuramoyl-L-alanine amidase